MNTKTIIAIVGPTAVGKTSLAIRIAERLQTQIISADSRQCYRELNIGVAKPSTEELARVQHYFINSHSIHQEVNAATFEQYALEAALTIFQQQNFAILVGGTGLYIKAFLEGIDPIPPIQEQIRLSITEEYRLNGLEWLQRAVATEDPVYYSDGELQNPARLMRALEVKRSTGNSIRTYQANKHVQRPFNVLMFGLELPKEILHRNIELRTEEMIRNGLVNEVEQLLPHQHLQALNTVGYKELFAYFAGRSSISAAIEHIKANTRQYAKRQLTWFKKQPASWIHPDDDHKILAAIKM